MIFDPGDINLERAILVETEMRKQDSQRDHLQAMHNLNINRDRELHDIMMFEQSQMYHLYLILSRFELVFADIQNLNTIRNNHGK